MDRNAFRAKILAASSDEEYRASRLVFADWLGDHGELNAAIDQRTLAYQPVWMRPRVWNDNGSIDVSPSIVEPFITDNWVRLAAGRIVGFAAGQTHTWPLTVCYNFCQMLGQWNEAQFCARQIVLLKRLAEAIERSPQNCNYSSIQIGDGSFLRSDGFRDHGEQPEEMTD